MPSFKEKIETLYKELPEIDKPCPTYCSACCNDLSFFWSVHEALMAYSISGKFPEKLSNGYCGYLENGRCSIYEHRPMTCRSWGTFDTGNDKWLDKMYTCDCKYGIRTTKPMSSKQYADLMMRYIGLCVETGYLLFPIGAEREANIFQALFASHNVQVLGIKKPKDRRQAENIKMKLMFMTNKA